MTNNTPYSQFRNVVERKVSMLKKIMKQVICRMPGPTRVSIPRDLLATACLAATSMVNNIPYQQVVGNSRLLAPIDFFNPWKVAAPSTRELPSSNMKSVTETKRQMDITQEKMRRIILEEIKTSPERFRQGRVKPGSNKTSPPATMGDIVLTELPNQIPELGYVELAVSRNVTLCRADGRRLQLLHARMVSLRTSYH